LIFIYNSLFIGIYEKRLSLHNPVFYMLYRIMEGGERCKRVLKIAGQKGKFKQIIPARIDDKLSKYFPGFRGGEEITLQDLLLHTSGIKEILAVEPFGSNEAV